jgi:NTP pyrophosphatase (non-canonical NTP hydrolase)
LTIDESVMELILAFRKERDWEQFHTPRNLAVSITLEATELLEIFQWVKDKDMATLVERKRSEITDEIADIFVYLLFLCHDLGIDPKKAIVDKMKKNVEKYPAQKARGKADKYDELR